MSAMTSEHERYVNAWRDRRRRLTITWSSYISLICFFLGLGLIRPVSEQMEWDIDFAALLRLLEPFEYIILLWFLLCLLFPFYLYRFRCPRCGDRFFGPIWRALPFGGKCLHCGTPKGWLPGDKESIWLPHSGPRPG